MSFIRRLGARILRPILAATAAVTFSGCVDMEIELAFPGDDQVHLTGLQTMERALYDMGGPQGGCEGEEFLTAETYTCATERTMMIDELLAEDDLASLETGDGMSIERIGDSRLEITFDFDAMMANSDSTPQDMEGMEEIVLAAVAGHSFIFRVSGYEIEETTGTISEDGKTAEFVIPLSRIIQQEPLGMFRTTVLTEKPDCFLGILCG